MTNKQLIIAKIRSRPGITAAQITEETGVENPISYIVGEIDRCEIEAKRCPGLVDGKVVAEFTYRINPEYPPEQILRAEYQDNKSESFCAAFTSRGELIVSAGGSTIRMKQDHTRRLLDYLQQVNVEQVIKAAGGAA